MDLIRIYTDIAFSYVASRQIRKYANNEGLSEIQYSYPLDEDCFIDEGRIRHPELSDDTLKIIYKLGIDDWSRFGYENHCDDDSNIFQVLACLCSRLAEERNGFPIVHFKDLFRWREITQLLGEDLLTCALLAFNDRHTGRKQRRFDWPSVIHNDNPHLQYLFSKKRLCELHSHLKASTNTFEISWVCLMNNIDSMEKQFEKLAKKHEPSNPTIAEDLYQIIIRAADIRWQIYQYIRSNDTNRFQLNRQTHSPSHLDAQTAIERDILSEEWIPDYICFYPNLPMSVYAGERWFLYSTLRKIYSGNDPKLTSALYLYVLSKSLLRSFFIQANNNLGFSNFNRFQKLKGVFLKKEYKELIESLPLWEAKRHNYTEIFESRIIPVEKEKQLKKQINKLTKWTNGQASLSDEAPGISEDNWLLIFHFIKCNRKNSMLSSRDEYVRNKTKLESHKLSRSTEILRNKGIDAASSEFATPPEAFAQGFRFLRHFDFSATFHAGEDFYDIADGLRAIDETITFLELKTADRIGHALALGIDAKEYYDSRHNTTAMPKQHMLDNAVWMLMRSRQLGISMDPKTEWFLTDIYKKLSKEIGYTCRKKSNDSQNNEIPDIADYWDSMILRGDNPEAYATEKTEPSKIGISPDDWDYYALLNSDQAMDVRNFNPEAVSLFCQYHSETIINNGAKVRSYQLPEGYESVITDLQNAMICIVSKHQICIECCPSSNLRIGRLNKFESHPIFRFMPVRPTNSRCSLAVTVNTDDLGVFSTSLPNEYSLLALALLKKKDKNGQKMYSSQEVYDWISKVIDNSHKFTFLKKYNDYCNATF